MIYFFDEPDKITDEFISKAVSAMPSERADRALKAVRSAKLENAVGYVLLLFGLNCEFGVNEAVSFTYGKNDKPYLSCGKPFFSLSHSDGCCVCCLSDTEVGADIQKIEDGKQRCASRVCSAKELASLKDEADFIRLWTQKESLIKRLSLNLGAMKTLPDLSECVNDGEVYKVSDNPLITQRLGDFYLSVCGVSEFGMINVTAEQLSDFLKQVD